MDGFWLTDMQGCLLDVNETYCRMSGYSREELAGMHIPDLEVNETPAKTAEHIRKVEAVGEDRFETRHRRKDGTIFHVEVSVQYQAFENGRLVMFLRDITANTMTKEALKESENAKSKLIERLNDAQHIAAIGSWDWDLRTNEVWWSDETYNIFGVPRDTFKPSFEGNAAFIHPGDLEKYRTSFEHSLRTGTLLFLDLRLVTHGGEIKYCYANGRVKYDESGQPVHFTGTLLDMTERKRAEQLLGLERERLAVTLRSIGDGVITTDTTGAIVMLNKAAEAMTGWETKDAAGRPLPEVFVILNEITREVVENPVDKVLKSGNIVELANHTCLISRDGREIVIADSGAPIRDNESQIIGVVLVFRDITEKQKMQDSIQRAQKLESLGILAGGIAHDFNNMLAGIFGYLDMARVIAEAHNIDRLPKYLNKAIGIFDRAKGLTQQLLTFSKGGTPIRRTIQLAPLIHHSANFALSGSNVTCQFEGGDDLWLCDCDETQIGQVVDNIVINGKQAMPLGGTIVIKAVNVSHLPGHPGKFVKISIQDHGIGMPKEILAHIFDPFFSTKNTGHGLGLATVFSIIQRHDGWIDVESSPGKGSVFHLYLPASQRSHESTSQTEIVDHTGSGSILVMDDEEFMLEIVGNMLQEMGYRVEPVRNGKDALQLFTDAYAAGRPYAASILDLTIPGGVGGKTTAASMRLVHPAAIIIASSGYSEDPVIADPAAHGFTDKIIKPYRKNDLTKLFDRLMKRRES